MQTSTLPGASPETDTTGSAAQQHLRLGLTLFREGRPADAIAAFRQGLAEAEKSGAESTETVSELHARLGNVAAASGDVGLASANYQAALTIAPHLTNCWCSFGDLHLRCGQPQTAIELYLKALSLNPRHWAARANMVHALMAAQQYLVAKAILIELKSERPEDSRIHHLLGKTLYEMGEIEPAIASFQEAVALNPQDAESLNWIGALRQTAGDDAAAQAAYAEAARIEPLIRRPALRQPAEFRVLALYAPFGGNTPTEYLFQDAFFDTDTLSLFPEREYDTAALGRNIQLVINLVSDADQTADLLPLAADLVERLGLPTVNHPRKVQQTTRDEVAKLLAEIPGCRVPQALRLKAGTDHSETALKAALPFTSSCLARPVGTHGGDDFEKVEDLAALSAFLSQRTDHDHYLIEYIDYLSRDDYFRKYRFIFVDDQVLPYHLCIGRDWKLHHINTDMAHHAWMQQEEAAFLNDSSAAFGPAQMQALHDYPRAHGSGLFRHRLRARPRRQCRGVRGQCLDAGPCPQRRLPLQDAGGRAHQARL